MAFILTSLHLARLHTVQNIKCSLFLVSLATHMPRDIFCALLQSVGAVLQFDFGASFVRP